MCSVPNPDPRPPLSSSLPGLSESRLGLPASMCPWDQKGCSMLKCRTLTLLHKNNPSAECYLLMLFPLKLVQHATMWLGANWTGISPCISFCLVLYHSSRSARSSKGRYRETMICFRSLWNKDRPFACLYSFRLSR